MACDQAFPIDVKGLYDAEMYQLAGRLQLAFSAATARTGGHMRRPLALAAIQDLLERGIIEPGPGLFQVTGRA